MKINLKNLKLKPKKTYKKGSTVIHPNFYWNFVLLVVLFIVVFAFVYGFFMFRKVNKEFISEDLEINQKAGEAQRARLNKALEYFRDRAVTSEAIKNSPSPLIDPSI